MQAAKPHFLDKIIIISGPTASGKSELAEKISDFVNSNIINGDALQIYKGLETLNASPHKKESNKYYLYNFLEAKERYSVAKWLDDVTKIIDESLTKKKTPIIVGGTLMYLNSLINGIRQVQDIKDEVKQKTIETLKEKGLNYLYNFLCEIDPQTEEILNQNDTNRIIRNYNIYKNQKITPSEYQKLPNKLFYQPEKFIILNLKPDRKILYEKSEIRFKEMFKNGAVEEVKKLKERGVSKEDPIAKTIGFKEIYDYLNGKIDKETALEKAKQETRNFIKRQFTWANNQINENIVKIEEEDIISLLKKFKTEIC